MGTAHECDKLISFPYSQRLGATLAQALETGLASWVARTRAAESVSCVFPAPKLKREQSLAARFGRADASYYDISSTWIADGFLSSSPTCPGRQSGLHQPLADDRRCYRRKGKKSPRTLRKTAGLSVRLLAGWGPRGRESVRRFLEAKCALPRNHVVVKHSADSGCVGHPVAKCREAPLLFSAVNLRSQDRRAKRYRRGACRGS